MRVRRVCGLGVAGVVVCGVLAAGVSPVWAGEPGVGAPPLVELGSFSVGDGLEGVVNEADGSFGVAVPVGGLSLSWDSRVPLDRYGFGPGWGLGLAVVEVRGGVQVFPSSGGVFAADASVRSGLAGYSGTDVVFRQVPGGVLPGRADGVVGEREFAFELHELGGTVTYFNRFGDPVARVTANEDRADWEWAEGDGHRLVSVVNADGVVTELDWSDPGEVLMRPGVNVPAGGGGAGVWRVRLEGGRVDAVVDPVDGRSSVAYDPTGRVVRVGSGSGAVTQVAWRADTDGVSRVDRVGVADPDGAELSTRQWRQLDGALPSGWPAVDPAGIGALATSGTGGTRSVEVSDGKTRVVSSFDEWGRLAGKRVLVSSPSGERAIQEQSLTYPEGEPIGVGGSAGKPVASEVRFLDQAGGVRTGTEAYEYDELGRMALRVAADGTILERAYDPEVPEGRLLPVGLPVVERSTAPDGSVTSTDAVLDATRTVPTLVEQSMQAPGADRVSTGRSEYTVEDGAVIEQRMYPGADPQAEAVATRWDERVDLGGGVRTVTETVAAGTDLEATTSMTASLLHGGTLTATDVLGNTSSAEYDEAGRVVAARDAAGRISTMTYRRAAVDGVDAVTVTGPDGLAVTEVRDVLGRVIRKHDNLDEAGDPVLGVERLFERHEFLSPGVTETTDAWGATTRVEQDVHGRPIRVTLPNGLVQVTEHDEVAATITTGTTPTGRLADAAQTTTSRMDLAGRVIGTDGARADGFPVPAASTVFDGFGREVEATNDATRTRVEYDALGNPESTTISPADPARAGDPLVARRRFDGFGTSLEKTMSAGGQERSGGTRELDVFGRTVTETDQAGGTTRYEYTPDGLPARVTTSAGQRTTTTYDDTTRAVTELRVETAGQPAVVTGFAYDEHTDLPVAVFDPADRGATEISYTYDGFGNIRTVQYPVTQAGQPGAILEHEYDRHGRRSATIDVAGNRSEFAYADDGFLTGVEQTDASERELARIGYTADEYGRIQQVTRGNGVSTEYEFTSAGEIAAETTTAADGTVHAARAYEYDPATGNLLVRVDRTLDEASEELRVERREYAYDLLKRLTASTIRDGEGPDAPITQTVGYEITVSGQVGTETTSDGASGDVRVREFAYSPTGALDAITTTRADGAVEVGHQIYDQAGNLTLAADGTEYEWDAANRQTGQLMPDGTRIESSYWADGTRKARTTGAGSTTYHWDGTALINDTHTTTDGQQPDGVASYVIGASRHARTVQPSSAQTDGVAAAETRYYHTDRHGNVTGLTDHAGASAGTYEYSDYGVASTRSARTDSMNTDSMNTGSMNTDVVAGLPGAVGQLGYNPFQYAMEYTHADGTQFLRERTYQPGHLTMTSKDRESLHDLYGYANANPIMLIDPSGRSPRLDWAALGLNAAGIALGILGAVWALTTAGTGAMFGLGIAAAVFSLADAAYTAVQTYALVKDTKFMPDEDSLALGVGLAGAGLVFGIAGGVGKLLARTSGTTATVGAAATETSVVTTKGTRTTGTSIVSEVIPTPGTSTVSPGTPTNTSTNTLPQVAKQVGPRDHTQLVADVNARATYYNTQLSLDKRTVDLLGTKYAAEVGDLMHPQDIMIDAWNRVQRRAGKLFDTLSESAETTQLGKAIFDAGARITNGRFQQVHKLLVKEAAGSKLLPRVQEWNAAIDNIHRDLARIMTQTEGVHGATKLREAVTSVQELANRYLLKF